ncbi:S41 family peptidase [Alicyclobacillus acidoterrestris]
MGTGHVTDRANANATSPVNSGNVPINLASLSPTGIPTTTDKKQVFTEIWNLFNENYPNFEMKGVDWSTERIKYESKAIDAGTWPQFFSVVNTMIHDLDDSHCYLIGAPSPTTYTPLILTAWCNGQVVVMWSYDSSKVPVGSVVTSVDGAAVSTRLSRPDFSSGYIEGAGQEALMTDSNHPEQLSFRLPSSHQTRTATVPVYPLNGSAVAGLKHIAKSAWAVRPGATYGDPIAKGDLSFRVAYLGNDILYVYIPAMEPPDNTQGGEALASEFQHVLQLALHSKGMVIDIRGNSGGDMWPALWFARHLYSGIERPTEVRFRTSEYVQLPSQLTDGTQRIALKASETQASAGFTKWGVTQISPLAPKLNIPVALLTDGWNVSAAENFTVFMKSASNVSTFGSVTGGSDGSPQTFPVMKGVEVSISTWQERVMATGLPIEGFGLHPDHPIYMSDAQVTEEMIRSQQGNPRQTMDHDSVLQAAQAWVEQQVKNGRIEEMRASASEF